MRSPKILRRVVVEERVAETDCIFCRIVAGEIPARFVYQDDLVVAFHDINPRAPTHILLLPREHIPSAQDLTEAHGPMLGRLFATSARLAQEQGIAEAGYRITTNVGRDGGQTVDHLHFHVMGGRPFTWPPG